MNRQQLLQTAQRKVDERRFRAEAQHDRLLEELRKNPEYRICERKLRMAQVRYATSDDENKAAIKLQIEKYKSELNKILASYKYWDVDVHMS